MEQGGVRMDWSPFYTAMAGASATLLGLLFVAVQFNIDAITTATGNRWWAVARTTFYMYVTIFVISVAFLIPALSTRAQAGFILFSVAVGSFRAIVSWLPAGRELFRPGAGHIWQTVWLLLAPLAAYATLGYSAFQLIVGRTLPGVFLNIAFAIIALLVIVLRNSWNLLFELFIEKRRKGSHP